MTKEEALKIIEDEKLTNYKWFEDTMVGNHYVVEDIVSIRYVNGKWMTSIIGKRDCIIDGTELYFDSEASAIDDFFRRLRLINEIIESRQVRKARGAETR